MLYFPAEVGDPLQSHDVHFDGSSEIKIESHSGGRMENNGNIVDENLLVAARDTQFVYCDVTTDGHQLLERFWSLLPKRIKYLQERRWWVTSFLRQPIAGYSAIVNEKQKFKFQLGLPTWLLVSSWSRH